jgi:phage protein D
VQPIFIVSGATGAITGPGGKALSCEVIDQEEGQSDELNLVLDDRELLPILANGTQLSVSMGYRETGALFMGTFTVEETTVLGWPRTMVIKATAADMNKKLKEGRSQDYHNKTVGDIVGEIASRHGLAAAVTGKVASFKYTHIAQTSESDLHFMRRLAEKHDAIGKITNGRLVFSKKGEGVSASGLPLGGAVARYPDNVKAYHATFKGRPAHQSSTTGWWDKDLGERIEEEGMGSSVSPVQGGKEAVFKVLKMQADGKQEAQETAQSRADQLARDEGELNIVLLGEPGILAGSPLQVVNVRPDVDGTWRTKKVTHFIDTNGYETIIDAELGGSGGGGGGDGMLSQPLPSGGYPGGGIGD